MNFLGKTTIHPLFFFTGKIAGYFVWILYSLAIFTHPPVVKQPIEDLGRLSYSLSAIALTIIIISLINLGRSTRFGLPQENTKFVITGLYRYSRNPMYLGFNLLTLSALIFTMNPVIVLIGTYGIIIYHYIIRGEEAFLEKRFGHEYARYKKKVRRYI